MASFFHSYAHLHFISDLGVCSAMPCQNGGTCNETPDGQNFNCTCPAKKAGEYCHCTVGWTGDLCDTGNSYFFFFYTFFYSYFLLYKHMKRSFCSQYLYTNGFPAENCRTEHLCERTDDNTCYAM